MRHVAPPRLEPSSVAIGLMLVASALVAATSLLAKTLGIAGEDVPGLNPFQVSAGRFAFGLTAIVLFLLLVPSKRPGLAGATWRWHILRSISGWLGVTCMFAAVARMPVAEATAISFLSPLVAMALSVVMLGERIGPRKAIAAALAVAGAALIMRPGSEAFQVAGLLALAAAVFMGLETIFIKRLSDTEPALRVLLINNAIGASISVIVATLVWAWPTPFQWALLIGLGVVMVSGQAFFIQAMKRGQASFVIPAFYAVLVFVAVYDFILFDILPSGWAVLGAALILSGALILALRNEQG